MMIMMWLLHLIALIFFLPALFVTIQFHILISVMKKRA